MKLFLYVPPYQKSTFPGESALEAKPQKFTLGGLAAQTFFLRIIHSPLIVIDSAVSAVAARQYMSYLGLSYAPHTLIFDLVWWQHHTVAFRFHQTRRVDNPISCVPPKVEM